MKFSVATATMSEERDILLYVTGQPLFRHEYYSLTSRIHKALRRHTGPDHMLRLLATAVREVADRNVAVGKNLMMISLPKREPSTIKLPNGETGIFYPSALPSKESASFYYLSEKGESIEYGPNVANYRVYLTDFKHEVVDGEERTSVVPGFLDLD
jgi:hypothetical protein